MFSIKQIYFVTIKGHTTNINRMKRVDTLRHAPWPSHTFHEDYHGVEHGILISVHGLYVKDMVDM